MHPAHVCFLFTQPAYPQQPIPYQPAPQATPTPAAEPAPAPGHMQQPPAQQQQQQPPPQQQQQPQYYQQPQAAAQAQAPQPAAAPSPAPGAVDMTQYHDVSDAIYLALTSTNTLNHYPLAFRLLVYNSHLFLPSFYEGEINILEEPDVCLVLTN